MLKSIWVVSWIWDTDEQISLFLNIYSALHNIQRNEKLHGILSVFHIILRFAPNTFGNNFKSWIIVYLTLTNLIKKVPSSVDLQFIFMFFFHKAKTIISTICAQWDCKIYMSKISLRKNKKIPRNSIVQIVADA